MVVPNGWALKPLEKIMRIRKERVNPQAYKNIRCIELEHIEPESGQLLGWIESKNQRSLKAMFTAGDVLFGKLRPYLRKYYYPNFDGVCSTEFWVFTACDDSVDNNYIYYIVQTNRFLETANSTTGTKMPRADWSLMKEVSFSVPLSLHEQRTTVTALSDVDKYITVFEKLIAKKRAIKQGAMQELLTGKRRLPGYKGEWVEKQLGEISEVRMCKRIFAHQTVASGDIPFYKIGTFGKQPDAYISRALYEEYINKYSYPNKGDILLSAAGTIGRTVVFDGTPSYYQDSNIVWLEIDKSEICNEYLYHYYQVIEWASPEGSTISRLYNGIIKATIIKLPPTLAEQRAIAAVLSDMDAEIAALTSKLEKARRIKQGMMSELLTGRIRLIEGDVDNGKN
ncbi:restriction endonuclease subunit S [Brevibacillus borstelensis]|uniref:restriction endonuclease subunit S n=1 Tax=Brevibacillus borstelensis TaxID=45462 RepID=UPI0030D5A230